MTFVRFCQTESKTYYSEFVRLPFNSIARSQNTQGSDYVITKRSTRHKSTFLVHKNPEKLSGLRYIKSFIFFCFSLPSHSIFRNVQKRRIVVGCGSSSAPKDALKTDIFVRRILFIPFLNLTPEGPNFHAHVFPAAESVTPLRRATQGPHLKMDYFMKYIVPKRNRRLFSSYGRVLSKSLECFSQASKKPL
jgi:hypothetical protein